MEIKTKLKRKYLFFSFKKKGRCCFEKDMFVVQALWQLQNFLAVFLSFKLSYWA